MIPSLLALAVLAGGIVLIILGAEGFFAGLLGVARRLRISAFFITALISGLEIENIAAGLAAGLAGFPGAAAGTFLGGTTFVCLGVAGLGGLLVPFRAFSPLPFLLITATTGAPLAVLSLDRELSRFDGILLIAWFCLAMGLLYRATGTLVPSDDGEDSERKRFPGLWLLGGLAAMTAGGELLGFGLQNVVGRLGISPTLLGNTAIAALTEAEELARVTVPARRGRPDVAAANVGGTAIHFLTLNPGILAVILPLRLDEPTMRLHLPVAIGAPAVFSLALALRGGLGRWEGLLLILLYVAYIVAAVTGAFGAAS